LVDGERDPPNGSIALLRIRGGWALVGLTVPQERLRADVRREVAEHVYSALYRPKMLRRDSFVAISKWLTGGRGPRGFA
jgi:hypothetical protein